MPAFPRGRVGARPTRGSARPPPVRDPLLDPVTTPQSWYARWTARALGVTAAHGARLARLAAASASPARTCCTRCRPTAAAPCSPSRPAQCVVSPTTLAAMQAGRNLLVCTVCHAQQPGTAAVIDQLDGAPCLLVRCPGQLRARAAAGQLLPAASTRRPTCAGSLPGNTPACSTTSLGCGTRTASRQARPTRARRTCWSPRRLWRWASTSATCPRCCWPRCPGRWPRTCSGSAGPAASPATRSTWPSSPAAASTCHGCRTRCRSSTAGSARPRRTSAPRRSCSASTSPTSSTASPGTRTGRTRDGPGAPWARPMRAASSATSSPSPRPEPVSTWTVSSAASATWPPPSVANLRAWASPAAGEPRSSGLASAPVPGVAPLGADRRGAAATGGSPSSRPCPSWSASPSSQRPATMTGAQSAPLAPLWP